MPGWASAQNIWYLQDLNSVIIDELFPGLLTQPSDDWLATPGPGRRADEVAEFYFVHRYTGPSQSGACCLRVYLCPINAVESDLFLASCLPCVMNSPRKYVSCYQSSLYNALHVRGQSAIMDCLHVRAGTMPQMFSGGTGNTHSLSENSWLALARRPFR